MSILADKIQTALGGIVPLPLRDRVAALRKGTATTVFIRYDEVKDWTEFEKLINEDEIVLMDGAEGVELGLRAELCNV